ncbi:MAG: hypothetical protein WEF51_06150 [Chloroflexota bacterium]
MTFAPRAGLRPLARSFTSVIAVAVLLATLALPAAAAGPVKLSSPSVSPSGGTTATPFTFTVTYRHRAGSPPANLRLVVEGIAHPMVASGGDGWKRGVTFSVTTTLPAGRHTVRFVAVDPDGNEGTIAGGEVRVARPSTGPQPASTPVPRRTPAPQPRTTPAPPAVVDPNVVPDPSSDGAGPNGGDPDDLGSEPPTTGVGGAGQGGGGANPGDPGSGNPDGRGSGEVTAGLPGSWGDLTRYLAALGLDPAGSPFLRLVPVMIWTTGGVALLMAFGFFGKRRRDGEPPEPDEVLSAHAARGTGEAATAALVPDGAAPPNPIDLEMAMPRWRRPSLLQARKADPLRDGERPARLSFDHAAVAPIAGYERRLIRYMVVQLLDTPDEFRGAEIGALAQGDEVQLLERSGTYWRVFCPDGSEGWIHRMTLGDVVGEPPAPSARDTWATSSVQAEEVDQDVLVAFMTARGRA